MAKVLVFGQDVIVRVASEDIRAVSGFDASIHAYTAALFDEPEIAWSYTFGSPTASAASVAFSVANTMVGAAAIIAGGRMLAGMGAIWFGGPGSPLHFTQQPWRLITYGFMHGGLMHLLFIDHGILVLEHSLHTYNILEHYLVTYC